MSTTVGLVGLEGLIPLPHDKVGTSPRICIQLPKQTLQTLQTLNWI